MSLATDIAEIKTHVLYLRERAEKEEVRGDKLEVRVTELEKSSIRTSAWAAGFGAAAAFLFSLLKDKLLALMAVSVFLLSCAQPEPIGPKWDGPVIVRVDPTMPTACKEALNEALAFWEHEGVDYLYAEEQPYEELCPQAAICVTTVDLNTAFDGRYSEAAAVTSHATYKKDPTQLSTATVYLDPWYACTDARAPTHELGHAMGLVDLYTDEDKGNVMYFSLSFAGRKLTEDQVEHVRQ